MNPTQELELMERQTPPCACDACLRLRAARRAPRMVPYGDGMRPAWHVPLTPEHAELKDALSAVCYAHPREAQWLGNPEMRAAWARLVAAPATLCEHHLLAAGPDSPATECDPSECEECHKKEVRP